MREAAVREIDPRVSYFILFFEFEKYVVCAGAW